MSIDFEELDYRDTPLGGLSLRRRTLPALGVEVVEVKLGDDFLMSSLFTAGEIALADVGLAPLREGPLDVVVGGLGLGYTAQAALRHEAVRSLVVVEALPAVIDWHRRGLVPLGRELASDPRCRFACGDFFARAASDALDPEHPGRRYHAILVDIDHSPAHVLDAAHAPFYRREGLLRLRAHLEDGGVFALWSNDAPDDAFLAELAGAFAQAQAHVVRFHNPLLDREAANTVYVARRASARPPGRDTA